MKCYYCGEDAKLFISDERILGNGDILKHYKCPDCKRKYTTIGGNEGQSIIVKRQHLSADVKS